MLLAEPNSPKLPDLAHKARRHGAFFSSRLSPKVVAKTRLTPTDYKVAFVIFSLATVARTYKLQHPLQVVFDETHFGHFAQEYFHGHFFVDVHPPLVKLVFYWIAVVFGWNGDFDFSQIGDFFDANVPYVAMRAFSAACGVVTAVLVFFALRASGCRTKIAAIGSLVIIFENALATQSRLIMLDSGLVAFTALAVMAFQKFQVELPFSRNWYKTLFATGVALGLAVSTKLTGLFTVAWVAVWSAAQVWAYVGDVNVSLKQIGAHIVCRLVAFVVVPLTIYCGLFSVHFMLLTENGMGAAVMSPSFKAGLAGSEKVTNTPVDVSYGSTVTIKHHRLENYLHSHDANYPTGSGEQQVTMYGYDPDFNNEWVLETHGTNYDGKLDTKFRPIADGDTVKIYHKLTQKYLRASNIRPANSVHEYSNEVSCHGGRTDTEDINYEWKVKIFGRKPHSENELPLRKLRTTESVFQLVHRGTQCVLVGLDLKLPQWGSGQHQVVCNTNPTVPNTLWYIESNSHPVIDDDLENYPRVKLPKLLLFRKLVEYHNSMWRLNKGLTEPHVYSSTPVSWPFLLRGVSYFGTGSGRKALTLANEPGSHIYFLGNVVVYFAGLMAVAGVGIWTVVHVFRFVNPFQGPAEPRQGLAVFVAMLQYASGWALHFVPYWFMGRQLFAHHYLPCVLFLVLTMAQFVENKASTTSRLWSGFWLRAFEACLVATVFVFFKLSPLIYGTPWTVKLCQHAKWFPGWDLDCMSYSH